MKIGIDFDNTIACYDTLFHEVALKENFISRRWSGCGKTELRNYLRNQPNGEKTWMKLQGLVYGKYMNGAEMLSGFANFILSCKARNYKVFIVSHKTEYGHYDSEKISLRNEALKWMHDNRFFDPEYFGINEKDVHFANTRREKVKTISNLKCDWFIDDLPEVFEESHFPIETKKVLFGANGSNTLNDIVFVGYWRKISEIILGQITDKDIVSWLNLLTKIPIEKLQKIPGRGNSKVYQITTSEGKGYALKLYPDQTTDKRPRLMTEFNTLQLLHRFNITNVPKSVEKSEELNIGLYEWINGESVVKPNLDNLEQAIDFVKQLYTLSQNIDRNHIDNASGACLSISELADQIDNRLLKLENNSSQELSIFTETVFKPLWIEVKDESLSCCPLEYRENILPLEKQTLSPSDFGFHNSIKLEDGRIQFIDFDYFGWDDPVKLTADFIWHPAMNLNKNLKDRWQKAMLELFKDDKSFEDRLNVSLPLYGLRWALIVLNEFLPGFADRRKEAGDSKLYDIKKARQIQLEKAHLYCDKVKSMVSQTAFA